MRAIDVPTYLRDTALRFLPHRAPTGLIRIGHPTRSSPVLVTCNFTLTIRRLREVLSGRDAWLLCANSNGINVWCAAGGGHLTHHDVISVVRTSGIEREVDGRELILPQLGATGIEPKRITEVTGWKTRWGPARLEDLPAYLDRGKRVKPPERHMRFPLWERLEMAAMWNILTAAIAGPIFGLIGGWRVGVATALLVLGTVFALFAMLPVVPIRRGIRWLTMAAFAGLGFGIGAGALAALAGVTPWHLLLVAIAAVITMLVVAVDLAGSTPLLPSYINSFHNNAHIELIADKCTGAADCVKVCPSDVLEMTGRARKVKIARDDQCIQCGACIVQCPEDALRFRYDDGHLLEAPAIRATRMGMTGRRTVAVKA